MCIPILPHPSSATPGLSYPTLKMPFLIPPALTTWTTSGFSTQALAFHAQNVDMSSNCFCSGLPSYEGPPHLTLALGPCIRCPCRGHWPHLLARCDTWTIVASLTLGHGYLSSLSPLNSFRTEHLRKGRKAKEKMKGKGVYCSIKDKSLTRNSLCDTEISLIYWNY